MSVIERLVNDCEPFRMTVVQDFPEFNSRLFMKCLVMNCLESQEDCFIHFICNETPARHFVKCTEIYKSRIKVYDMFMDSPKWTDDGEKQFPFELDFLQSRSTDIATQNKNVYVFDSITEILIHQSVSKVCRLLERLIRSQPGSSIICLLHPEVHLPEEISMIEQQACNVLKIEPSKQCGSFGCFVTHKKISGKVLKHAKQFSLNCVSSIHDIKDIGHSVMKPEEKQSNESDPAANLSFNLSLKPNEVEARNKLVLPFTKTDKEISEGKIIYHHDDVDDYDEEDPDDDLDI